MTYSESEIEELKDRIFSDWALRRHPPNPHLPRPVLPLPSPHVHPHDRRMQCIFMELALAARGELDTVCFAEGTVDETEARSWIVLVDKFDGICGVTEIFEVHVLADGTIGPTGVHIATRDRFYEGGAAVRCALIDGRWNGVACERKAEECRPLVYASLWEC